ncbi:MAG TPA: BrnT family toxin [Pyrinomonadaceae bacterium]|nr:BrnT family toxin [Pyrinomonadaceae bacterium]
MTKFEWDAEQAKLNLRKHRVSFEEAETAILDEFSQTTPDPDRLLRRIDSSRLASLRDKDCWLFAIPIAASRFA